MTEIMQQIAFLCIVVFTVSTAVAKDLTYATESDQHPMRYDLMRELPLDATAKPYAPRFGKSVVRPALSNLVDSFREKSKLRKATTVLPVPRRKPFSGFRPSWPRINEDNRVARVERAFDRVVGFVDLVGKLDSVINDRAKLAVRKLSAMYSEEERYKRGQ